MSSSAITPSWALAAAGEESWVLITMPSATVWVHEATGLRWPSISTRHWRQAPTGSNSGWSQKRGIWVPMSSAARITSVPGGTETVVPSMVTVTRSAGVTPPPVVELTVEVIVLLERPRRWTGPGRTGRRRGGCARRTRRGSI